MFNQFNRKLYYIRLTQMRSNATSCDSYRTNLSLNRDCDSFTEIITSSFLSQNSRSYNYTADENSNFIRGVYRDYDNSGYSNDIRITDPNSYYEDFKNISNFNWVDSHTISLMVIFNFYNVNMDILGIIRILYERVEGSFEPKVNIGLISLDPYNDSLLIISVVFLVLNIVLSLISLIRSKEARKNRKSNLLKLYGHHFEEKPSDKYLEQSDFNLKKFIKKYFYKSLFYIKLYFIKPDWFQIISNLIIKI